MKKLNKNILFSLGTLAVTAAPVAAVVACGDSKKETTDNNAKKPDSSTSGSLAQGSTTSAPITIRPSADVITSAWDATTQTIDLEKVNNQFEFVGLLSDITALKNMKAISSGFDATNIENDKAHLHTLWDAVKTKFENLLAARPNETDITIKFGTESIKFNLGIYTFVNGLIKAIPAGDTATAANGNDIMAEMGAGADILSNTGSQLLIQALLNVNNKLAMTGLMKLTHLPKDAFNQFKGLVINIQTAFKSLITSQTYDAWIKAKNIDMGMAIDGTQINNQLKPGLEKDIILGAHFLVEVLDN